MSGDREGDGKALTDFSDAMRYTMHHSKIRPAMKQWAYDLVPDHPLSVIITGTVILVANLFQVSTTLIWAALILFFLNSAMSFVWSLKVRGVINGELGATLAYRLVGYVIGLAAVIVFSNLPSIGGDGGMRLRAIAFQAVAGIEFVVTLGLLARIVPLFRPFYVGLLRVTDNMIPWVDFGTKKIEAAIDSYPGHSPEEEGDAAKTGKD